MNSNQDSDHHVLTVRAPGDLLSTNAEALRGEVSRLLEPVGHAPRRRTTIRLDLSAAAMIDSVGLNLVVALLKRCRQEGLNLEILYSSPNILRTFAFTRLDKHICLTRVPEEGNGHRALASRPAGGLPVTSLKP